MQSQPEPYLPRRGELVRVLAVHINDMSPCVKAGDIVEATANCPPYPYNENFVQLFTTTGLTFCMVEPAAPESEGPQPVPLHELLRPVSISEAIVNACEAEAASIPPSRLPSGCVPEGAGLPVTIEQTFEGRTFLNDCAEDAPPAEAVNPKEVAASGEARIPWQCLPVRPLVGAALAMGEGAHKYGRHNYRKTRIKSSVYFDALLRHFFAWWEGEDIDPDSGLHHIDKAIACLLVLRDAQLRGMSDDDRPPTCETGWVKAAGGVFGQMRAKLLEQFGEPKPAARADG